MYTEIIKITSFIKLTMKRIIFAVTNRFFSNLIFDFSSFFNVL